MLLVVRSLFILTMLIMPATLILPLGIVTAYTLDLAFVPLLFAFLLSLAFSRQTLHFAWRTGDLAVLALFGTIALSTLFSSQPLVSLPALADWTRYVVLYFVARTLFSSGSMKPNQLIGLWTILGTALLIIGMIQLIRGDRFGLVSNYFGVGGSEGTTARVNLEVVNRVSGPTPNSNIYAMWLTIFCLLPISVWLAGRQYLRVLLGLTATSIIMFSTVARGAILGYILSLIITAIGHRRMLFKTSFLFWAFIAIAVVLPVLALTPWLEIAGLDRLDDFLEARLEDRLFQQDATNRLQTIAFGFQTAFSGFRAFLFGVGSDAMTAGLVVHNLWVKLLAENGILVVLALVFLSIRFISVALHLSADRTPEGRLWSTYLLAIAIPFGVITSQVYPNAGSYNILIPLLVLFAFGVTRERQHRSPGIKNLASQTWRQSGGRLRN